MRWLTAATAMTAAALWAAPSPCAAAGEHLLGVGPEATPSPSRYRVERQVSLIATVVRYVEDHLGVEIVPASVHRVGIEGTPLDLYGPPVRAAGLPAMAGTFAVGGDENALHALNRMSAAVSASEDRLHLTLRVRW